MAVHCVVQYCLVPYGFFTAPCGVCTVVFQMVKECDFVHGGTMRSVFCFVYHVLNLTQRALNQIQSLFHSVFRTGSATEASKVGTK